MVFAAVNTYSGNTTIAASGALDLGGNTITTSAAFSMVGGTLQNGTVVNNGSNYVFSSGFVSASLEGSAA